MAYSNQLMNFSETKDYSGLQMRPATDAEINLVLRYEVEGIIRGLQAMSRCRWSDHEKKDYREKFLKQNELLAKETAMVYDFAGLKIKVFIYYNICINDHETADMDMNKQKMQFIPYRYIIDGETAIQDFFNEDLEFEL